MLSLKKPFFFCFATYLCVCVVVPGNKHDKWFIELESPSFEIFEELDYETIFDVLIEKN